MASLCIYIPQPKNGKRYTKKEQQSLYLTLLAQSLNLKKEIMT